MCDRNINTWIWTTWVILFKKINYIERYIVKTTTETEYDNGIAYNIVYLIVLSKKKENPQLDDCWKEMLMQIYYSPGMPGNVLASDHYHETSKLFEKVDNVDAK